MNCCGQFRKCCTKGYVLLVLRHVVQPKVEPRLFNPVTACHHLPGHLSGSVVLTKQTQKEHSTTGSTQHTCSLQTGEDQSPYMLRGHLPLTTLFERKNKNSGSLLEGKECACALESNVFVTKWWVALCRRLIISKVSRCGR